MGPMLPFCLDGIMAGASVALWWNEPQFVEIKRKCQLKAVVLVAASSAFLWSPLMTKSFGGSYGFSIGPTIDAIAISALTIWLICSPSSQFGKIFNSQIMIQLGTISYSLYLWQQLFLTPGRNITWTGQFPINIATAVLLGTISYFAIEKPALKFKRAFSCKTN
jgi:peptidoglycan/LPS O-acetylase OafA/YrhL